MSDEAHACWAMVVFFALMVLLVLGCTAVVAYWANSAAGLWSLVVPLFTGARFNRKDGADEDASDEGSVRSGEAIG